MPSTFAALGVPAHLARRLEARGLTEPFAIQTATLPDALAGRDVSGKAPTGSGKTIAFGLPLVAAVRDAQPRKPRGLVLVPTRELAAQVAEELLALGGGTPSVAAVYGGVGFGNQTRALRKGVDVLVACPGRLADLVRQRELTLAEVSFVVLDEADRMADMGFLPEVTRLLDQVRPDRQTLLFSATLDGAVDTLVRRYQHDPVRHEHEPEGEPVLSRHVFWDVERSKRTSTTTKVIDGGSPAIVFCRTKHGADRLARQLSKSGVSAAAIHGNRSQGQRTRALADFSKGKVQALVATDIAARGIHVDDVATVVHFDLPADHKDYVHRSGRTGRAGASGVVVSLVPPEQRKDASGLQRRLGLVEGIGPVEQADLEDDRFLARPEEKAKGGGASTGGTGGGRKGRSHTTNRGNGSTSRNGDGRGSGTGRPSGAGSGSRSKGRSRAGGDGRNRTGGKPGGDGNRNRNRNRSRNRARAGRS